MIGVKGCKPTEKQDSAEVYFLLELSLKKNIKNIILVVTVHYVVN